MSPQMGDSSVTGNTLGRVDRFMHGAVLLLAFALPFEAIRPLVSSPRLAFTGLELLAGVTLLIGAAFILSSHLRTGQKLSLRRGLQNTVVLPAFIFLFLVMLSALMAPEFRMEALKSAGRIAAGLAFYLLILALFKDRRRQHTLVWALILGAGASALLGLAEAAGLRALAPVLAQFKIKPTEIGGLLRVSASFQYATIAAAYFAMAAPLAIAVSAISTSRAGRVLALAISLLCTALVVLSVTRAGLAVLFLILLVLIALSWLRPACLPLRRPALLNLAFMVGILVIQMWLSPVVRTRYTTANAAGWYGAVYSAPAALTIESGETTYVEVSVINNGRLPWSAAGPHPVVLVHYWSDIEGANAYDLPGPETPLPYNVPPGQGAELSVPVSPALPIGEYRLVWGLRHKGVEWFRYRGVPEAYTVVEVAAGEMHPMPAATPIEEPETGVLPTLSRLSLWQAAVEMFAERPLLGHGPGVFRLLHGRYLGLDAWDTRVNANNLYLELLAGVGLLGLMAFGVMMAAIIFTPITPLRRPLSGPAAPWISGLVAALLAFLLHGLLDHFLEFTSIYLLFWTILGLLVVARRS